MFQRPPRAAFIRTSDALRNKIHPINAVGDVGIKALARIPFLAGAPRGHIVVGRRVDVGERLQECFGMSARNARRSAGRLTEIRPTRPRVELVWLPVHFEPHLVRLFLMPFQCSLGSVHFNPQGIWPAVRNLRLSDGPDCATMVPDDGGTVITQSAARLKSLQ